MKIFKIILSLLITTMLVACGNSGKEDALVVGTSADNPPYEFMQEGKMAGFDIDLIEAIAQELGREIVIKNMEFSALVPALTSRHIDLAIAGISANEVRSEAVDFSDTYTTSVIAMLTNSDANINSIEDLSGKKVGVQLGTTWEMAARSLGDRISNLEIVSINSNLILIEELKNHNIDAVILEDLQAKKFIEQNPNFKTVALDNIQSNFSITFAKGSELKDKVNDAIASLKAKGKIQELKKKWLEFESNMAPESKENVDKAPSEENTTQTEAPSEAPKEALNPGGEQKK